MHLMHPTWFNGAHHRWRKTSGEHSFTASDMLKRFPSSKVYRVPSSTIELPQRSCQFFSVAERGWVWFGLVGAGALALGLGPPRPLVWFGWVGLGSVRFGSGPVRFRSGPVRCGALRFGSVRLGWVGLGLVWFGLVGLVCLFGCLSVSLSLSSSPCLSSSPSLSPSPSLSVCLSLSLSLSLCLSFAGARKTLLRCRKNTALHKKHRLGAGKTPWVLETPLPRCWKNIAGVEKTPWCLKNTTSVRCWENYSLIGAEKTPSGAEKTLGRQKTPFWCCKNTLFRVLEKHRRCW